MRKGTIIDHVKDKLKLKDSQRRGPNMYVFR